MARWTASRAGCIWAGASTRTADELNALTINLACDEGWDSHDGARHDAEALLAQDSPTGVLWASDPDVSEWLSEGAQNALEYLNAEVAPEGHRFEFDDGLYLLGEGCERCGEPVDEPDIDELCSACEAYNAGRVIL